jgi:hypothetical protein
MLKDWHIDVLESNWVVIFLQYMIVILIVFSHESATIFGYNYLC